ncbi:MAG: FUSC family protein [Bacillaceae bacterium]
MKKLIISKTIMFLFVVVFVQCFQMVFSSDNILIGVSIYVCLSILLQRNLTITPWRYFFLLLGLNLFQGIAGFFAAKNLFLAIPLNFIAMFIVGYFFSYNLRKSLYIGFGLQYLFILTTPIAATDLPLRLAGLATGAALIMVAQLIVNRKKMTKTGNVLLISMIEELIKKIKDQENLSQFDQKMKLFKNMLYDHREYSYYFSDEGRVKLKISACLEKLDLLIPQIAHLSNKDVINDALMNDLINLKTTIQHEESTNPEIKMLSSLVETVDKTNKDSILLYKLVSTFDLLQQLIETLHQLEKNTLKETEKMEKYKNIPVLFSNMHDHIKNISTKSVRFTYAVRLGLGITIAAFVVDYFHFSEGRWLIYTMFSVIQPYSEDAKIRFKERFLGTILGIATILILFSIFKDPSSRTLVILAAGYLNSYVVSYRNIIWTVTIAAIGSAAITGDPNILSLNRLIFVGLGILLGMLLNKIVLPYNLVTGTKQLMDMHQENSLFMMKELYRYLKERNNVHTIHNLFTISSLIEERILLNNERLQDPTYEQKLTSQRILNNTIYELFLRIQHKKISSETLVLILDDIDRLIKNNNNNLLQLSKQIENDISNVVSTDDKLILTDILEIFRGFNKYEKA